METVWWCLEHRSRGARDDVTDNPACEARALGHFMRVPCRMVKRRLVDPDSLVVKRYKNGNWPERVLKVGDRYHMSVERSDGTMQPSCLADALEALLAVEEAG